MVNNAVAQTTDITPSPRILWVLGQIPFRPWQALAELIDNSLDAFLSAERNGKLPANARVDVNWSSSSVSQENRVIEINDNGHGIDLETVRHAVRAGYTSNDPIGNLGLFGMGFNIATARLGGITKFISARTDDKEWSGIKIDFRDLANRGSFSAPIVREPKLNSSEVGTKITIQHLNEGIFKELRDREAELRKTLEDVYAPILRESKIGIYINGHKLNARQYCIWSSERSVSRDGINVPAIIQIDRDLGSALFDVERNQYVPGAQEAELRALEAKGKSLPKNVIERHRKLRGWVGIQRHADPNDFGIDFVRNGRKILIKDKRLFSWDNPLTNELVLEYPVELGTTVGGRIVGEVHVDYLVPTYQKNDFDRSESSWVETILALRGEGPVLPKRRKAMGYFDKVNSPIGLLVNAYRRNDPGTRCLSAPNTTSREWSKHFYNGETAYLTDEKWWKAAQEADQAKVDKGSGGSAKVDEGDKPTDDVDDYSPPSLSSDKTDDAEKPTTPEPHTPDIVEDSNVDALTRSSTILETLSGEYSYGKSANLKVRAYAFSDQAGIIKNGERVPCLMVQDANECDFFFDKNHPLIAQYPLSPQDLLVIYLAERFKARDHLPDLVSTFNAIYTSKFVDTKVERGVLQDKAYNILEELRIKFEEHLTPVSEAVVKAIHEAAGDVEETIVSLIDDPLLLSQFQKMEADAIKVLAHVPERSLPRLLAKFPEHLLDMKVFSLPYLTITLTDPMATERARNESLRRIQSYLEDVVSLLSSNLSKSSKDELRRASLSLALLQECVVS